MENSSDQVKRVSQLRIPEKIEPPKGLGRRSFVVVEFVRVVWYLTWEDSRVARQDESTPASSALWRLMRYRANLLGMAWPDQDIFVCTRDGEVLTVFENVEPL